MTQQCSEGSQPPQKQQSDQHHLSEHDTQWPQDRQVNKYNTPDWPQQYQQQRQQKQQQQRQQKQQQKQQEEVEVKRAPQQSDTTRGQKQREQRPPLVKEYYASNWQYQRQRQRLQKQRMEAEGHIESHGFDTWGLQQDGQQQFLLVPKPLIPELPKQRQHLVHILATGVLLFACILYECVMPSPPPPQVKSATAAYLTATRQHGGLSHTRIMCNPHQDSCSVVTSSSSVAAAASSLFPSPLSCTTRLLLQQQYPSQEPTQQQQRMQQQQLQRRLPLRTSQQRVQHSSDSQHGTSKELFEANTSCLSSFNGQRRPAASGLSSYDIHQHSTTSYSSADSLLSLPAASVSAPSSAKKVTSVFRAPGVFIAATSNQVPSAYSSGHTQLREKKQGGLRAPLPTQLTEEETERHRCNVRGTSTGGLRRRRGVAILCGVRTTHISAQYPRKTTALSASTSPSILSFVNVAAEPNSLNYLFLSSSFIPRGLNKLSLASGSTNKGVTVSAVSRRASQSGDCALATSLMHAATPSGALVSAALHPSNCSNNLHCLANVTAASGGTAAFSCTAASSGTAAGSDAVRVPRGASRAATTTLALTSEPRVTAATPVETTGMRAAAAAAPAQLRTDGTGTVGERETKAEVYPFQAEVKRVLDIIVNSLYTDRDVFLRELISNAADACDKKRLMLQQQGISRENEEMSQQQRERSQHAQLFRGSIRVRADRDNNTLSIEDDGIGMTREELISNLGTIAQSGTYRFLEQIRREKAAATTTSASLGLNKNDASLIGQFGVGFYSAFLVANKVEVYSAAWRKKRDRKETSTTFKDNAPTAALPIAEAESEKDTEQLRSDAAEQATQVGDTAATERELEMWKWSSTCGQTFQLERVPNAAAERQRWIEEGTALRAQFQKQQQQQQLQRMQRDVEGGVTTPLENKDGVMGGAPHDLETEGSEEDEMAQWSGTRVVLHLKEDCDDYLEDYKLKELLRKYSEFVQLPIYIWSERIEYERVPEDAPSPSLPELQQPYTSSSSGDVLGGGEGKEGYAPPAAFSKLTPETMDEQLEQMQQQQRHASLLRGAGGGTSAATGTSGGRFKTVTRRYYEWEHLNTQPPIWRRDEKTLSDKDYVDFYKSTFKAYDDPLSFVHMKVEGQVEFNALLFVPGALPWELARNMFDEDSRGIRLYVKRVFINDKFADAVPRWLTFIRGVVDSDELPLNVGREILQKSRMLQVINKRLATKAVEMIKKIKADGGDKWRRFWENYGKYLKVGAVEDKDNQEELASLVQFYSTASPNALTDLSSYIDRMQGRNTAIERGEPVSLPVGGADAASASAGRLVQPRQQQAIYYLAAENRRAAEESPALELPKALGYEVIFGTEPLDEFFLASLSINQYKGFQVIDVNKADLKLGAEKAEDAAKSAAAMHDAAVATATPQDVKPPPTHGGHTTMSQQRGGLAVEDSIETKRIQLGSLCEWLQQILGSRVHGVQITDRLFTSPAVLVQGDFGLSPTMQRYMKQQAAAQGVSEQELYGASLNQPILELNPYHPIVQRLDVLVRRDVTDPKAKEVALQLFDVASLQGGYTLENPGLFAKRVVDMMKKEADAALFSQHRSHMPVSGETEAHTQTHLPDAQSSRVVAPSVQHHSGTPISSDVPTHTTLTSSDLAGTTSSPIGATSRHKPLST